MIQTEAYITGDAFQKEYSSKVRWSFKLKRNLTAVESGAKVTKHKYTKISHITRKGWSFSDIFAGKYLPLRNHFIKKPKNYQKSNKKATHNSNNVAKSPINWQLGV